MHHVTGQTVWAEDWDEPGCKNNMSTLYSQTGAVYWTLLTKLYIAWPLSYIYLHIEGCRYQTMLYRVKACGSPECLYIANDRFSDTVSTVHEMQVPRTVGTTQCMCAITGWLSGEGLSAAPV